MGSDEIKHQKAIRCTVSSDKMDKSRVAKIVRTVKHKVAGKYVKKTTKLMFHDENNESRVGDEVLVQQIKPKSARKSYSLKEIVKSHHG